MVDFRRMIPVLAVLALLLGLSVSASAQTVPFSCFTSGGVNTPDRAEGLTELVGDFLITCSGGVVNGVSQSTPMGNPVPTVNIQVFLNTAITSRLMSTSTTLPQPSEALLLLDEPAPGAQYGCPTATCTNVGSGSGIGFYGATLNNSSGVGLPFSRDDDQSQRVPGRSDRLECCHVLWYSDRSSWNGPQPRSSNHEHSR